MRLKLQSQQILLRFLGFYQGTCDGIWGPDTIAAKRKYEADPRFNPGIPSNGMPFPDRGQTPHNVYRVPGKVGFLRHVDMPDDYEDDIKAQLVTEEKARNAHHQKHNINGAADKKAEQANAQSQQVSKEEPKQEPDVGNEAPKSVSLNAQQQEQQRRRKHHQNR